MLDRANVRGEEQRMTLYQCPFPATIFATFLISLLLLVIILYMLGSVKTIHIQCGNIVSRLEMFHNMHLRYWEHFHKRNNEVKQDQSRRFSRIQDKLDLLDHRQRQTYYHKTLGRKSNDLYIVRSKSEERYLVPH